MAVQLLIDQHPTVVAPAIESALLSLSDPATLTWLLRVIEMAGDKATPIVATSRKALIKLAQGPWLTVRVLARQLLSSEDIPPCPPCEADPELLRGDTSDVLLLPGVESNREDSTRTDKIVDLQAGVRLSRAEQVLPRLSEAVRSRVDVARNG